MKRYNFDEIIDRKGSNCIKYDGAAPIYGTNNLTQMWIADMDFRTPEFILEAIQERLKHPVLGYFYHSDSFYNAIIRWMEKRHSWKIEKNWIHFVPGIVTGLAAIVRAFTEKGDKVLVHTPVYHPFFHVVENQERELVKVALKIEENQFQFDYVEIEKQLKTGVKMMIICNPHNPVGRCWKKEELQKVAELAAQYSCLIVSDEIHADLIMPGFKHIPMASVSEKIAQNTITCMAPSKTFNIAGLSSSEIIISNPELREIFKKEIEDKAHIHLGNVFGDIALEAAYTHGEEWLEQLLAYLSENLQYLQKRMHEEFPEIKLYQHEATYLVWLNFEKIGMTHKELWKNLIQKCGIALNDGIIFGKEGEYCMRMNIACPRATIAEAIDKLHNLR